MLVPNRELGTQLRRVAARLGADTQPPFTDESKLFSLEARHGGALARWPYAPGKAPDVLVATPSFAAAFDRDLDLWEGLSTLVLDEADMLLDGVRLGPLLRNEVAHVAAEAQGFPRCSAHQARRRRAHARRAWCSHSRRAHSQACGKASHLSRDEEQHYCD